MDLSLREAIGLVNNAPGNHLIELQGGETYELSLGCAGTDDANLGGDLDLTAVNTAVTIRASGLAPATITLGVSCTGQRLVHVTDGASLILQNLVLTGGDLPTAPDDASGEDGGAVKTNGDLSIVDSTVTANSAGDAGAPLTHNTGGGRGGAVYIFVGDLTAVNTVITDNRSGQGALSSGAGFSSRGGDGGALHLASTSSAITLIDSVLDLNRAGDGGSASGAGAIGGRGGHGGAVYSVGPVTLSGGRVGATTAPAGNQAGDGGDAIAAALAQRRGRRWHLRRRFGRSHRSRRVDHRVQPRRRRRHQRRR